MEFKDRAFSVASVMLMVSLESDLMRIYALAAVYYGTIITTKLLPRFCRFSWSSRDCKLLKRVYVPNPVQLQSPTLEASNNVL